MDDAALILVADDDPAIRRLVQEVLADDGLHIVRIFPDGSSLLTAADTPQLALIVLDLQMPGLNGVEVYRRLRVLPTAGHVPVLFITGRPDLVLHARLPGRYSVLAKPFSMHELELAAAALLHEAA